MKTLHQMLSFMALIDSAAFPLGAFGRLFKLTAFLIAGMPLSADAKTQHTSADVVMSMA
ncbi:hypothetical protein [Collimonas humicola]|uniref:hypothetical protein n=1 Tax=Collimonas humicola TaxID=2825886 RepID=UPI001B8B974D|nr:hypothetical protein [Collimonas humicola]